MVYSYAEMMAELEDYRVQASNAFITRYNTEHDTSYTVEDLNPQTVNSPFEYGTHNYDLYNAFQHAYVSGLITYEDNGAYADILGKLKETNQLWNGDRDWLDHNRDFYNNKKGRESAEQIINNDDIPENQKLQEIGDDIYNKLINADLIIDKNEPDNRICDEFQNFGNLLKASIPIPLQSLGMFGLGIVSLFNQAEEAIHIVPRTTFWDPIMLDLDNDGIETTTRENGIYFDHEVNGFAENSAWVGADDGLLVRDLDSNGVIDSGRELFGNNTLLLAA